MRISTRTSISFSSTKRRYFTVVCFFSQYSIYMYLLRPFMTFFNFRQFHLVHFVENISIYRSNAATKPILDSRLHIKMSRRRSYRRLLDPIADPTYQTVSIVLNRFCLERFEQLSSYYMFLIYNGSS